jgi:hypothetical protein
MGTPEQPPEKVSDRLLIWFVVAAWLLFGGASYVNLALVMISVLVLMALAYRGVVASGRRGARRNVEPGETEAAK